MLSITLRFPLGVYHAQAQSDFSLAEWPPHPVRLIAALVAAAHGGPPDDVDAAREVIARVARAGAPLIVAPRMTGAPGAGDDEPAVSQLRGASRWAPRNHELGELKKGISPRDLGRGRAEVHKVGVAIGDLPVTFTWPDLELGASEETRLRRVADDVTFVGTSRSPVLACVTTTADTRREPVAAWRPIAGREAVATSEPVPVRVPHAGMIAQLDTWHARRGAPVAKSGAPAKAPLVVAPRLGFVVGYAHDLEPQTLPALDPEHWGDMLVLSLSGAAVPKAPASFALARATRKALLDTYAEPGQEGEAPPILRGRRGEPHAAFVPLSFVAEPGSGSAAAEHADGHVLGIAVVLPHSSRVPDVDAQREAVIGGAQLDGATRVGGLLSLFGDARVLVPGVGAIALSSPTGRPRAALQESRYRRASTHWTTITPLVHSRYRTRKDTAALYDQVAAECRDVGLPAPAEVSVRRTARLRGAPSHISAKGLPASWTGPLKGPQAHLDLRFDRPIEGPVLLGRARHFGLGLCLPIDASQETR